MWTTAAKTLQIIISYMALYSAIVPNLCMQFIKPIISDVGVEQQKNVLHGISTSVMVNDLELQKTCEVDCKIANLSQTCMLYINLHQKLYHLQLAIEV